MRNCWACGIYSSFSGDFCPACQAKVDQRAGEEFVARQDGITAYQNGLDLCRNPHQFGSRVFVKWNDGWLYQQALDKNRCQTVKKKTGEQ